MYFEAGQDVSGMSFEEMCEAVAKAASDPDYLGELSESKRRDVERAAQQLPCPSPRRQPR